MKFPDVIFSAGFDRALAWTMLHSIWQATLIAVLAAIVLATLRHRPARLRYGVANLALLAVLLSSAGTFMYYLRPAHRVVILQPTEKKQTPAAINPLTKSAAQPQEVASSAKKTSIVSSKSFGRTSIRNYLSAHLPWIVSSWFMGMAVFLCRLLGSLSRVYSLRRRSNFPVDPYWMALLDKLGQRSGCYKGVELLESALVRTPFLIGHLKPMILFPIGLINRLSETEVEAILAHELAHVLRQDYLFNLLQSLVEVIFYFHPAVWWLSAQVRLERESACDDQAIVLLGSKVQYAKALVTIQEMAFYPQQAALAFAGSKRNQLLLRVQRLFAPPTTKFNIMEKWIATGLVVCSLVALAFGQQIRSRPVQRHQPQGKIIKSTASIPEAKLAAFPQNSGIWEATFSGDSVCMTFSSKSRDQHWVNGECFAKSNFTNLKIAPGETAFQLIRPAGTMAMTGKLENNTGYGRFEFTPQESYRTALTKSGMEEVDDALLLHCFLANFPADYVNFLQKSGYSKVSKEDLLQLAVFKLN
ncbi:MAG: M56 family metallopeptidase, partial [Saprospiraceae bacterium]